MFNRDSLSGTGNCSVYGCSVAQNQKVQKCGFTYLHSISTKTMWSKKSDMIIDCKDTYISV